MPPGSLLIRRGTILTMNDRLDVIEADVSIRDGRIVSVGGRSDLRHDKTIDAHGDLVLPGFIQTHLHLCQTLFRGFADDLPLMEWLTQRIWPMEAAHTPASLRASTRLAASELIRSGTTSILTMETVHGTEVVLETLAEAGLRAGVGKCMMDAGGDAPRHLRESTRASIDESLSLRRQWNGGADGRLHVVFAPRFAVSCTRELLEEVAALSAEHDTLVHTHASESPAEIQIVRELSGRTNFEYFADIGLASPRLCTAHCIWIDEAEQAVIAERDVKVLHCPGSNLKLGSGVAPVVELRARGVSVSLGADGAACNNRLDMFQEMRLAATLQAMRKRPGALPARDVVWMATREGARALQMTDDTGSIETGKRADVIIIRRSAPHLAPGGDPYSQLVYSATAADVRATIVDGEVLMSDGVLLQLDAEEIAATAQQEAKRLVNRAGV
ncbi:MAG: 5'-deoxyadenosine deaminase [Acidobacteria bacterium]|nr:5'-deoxyadenosine deaminase [Acidobacteriota bacterium]